MEFTVKQHLNINHCKHSRQRAEISMAIWIHAHTCMRMWHAFYFSLSSLNSSFQAHSDRAPVSEWQAAHHHIYQSTASWSPVLTHSSICVLRPLFTCSIISRAEHLGLWLSGFGSCQSNGLELSPRFYRGLNKHYIPFQTPTENVFVRMTLVYSVH